MSIKEVEKHEVGLTLPKILADRPLGISPQEAKVFSPTSFTMLLVGRPGSGKSSRGASLIATRNKLYWKKFHRIHLIVPPSSRASMKLPPMRKHNRTYDDLTEETLDEIMNETAELTDGGEDKKKFSLIYLDDFAVALKRPEINRTLQKIVFNHRHINLSLIVMCQSYRKASPDLRKCFGYLILFPVSEMESDVIFEELITWCNKKQWQAYCRYAFDVKRFGRHCSMIIDINGQKIFSNRDNDYYLLSHE
tara:strand:- start:49 stop:798 length:750 start_codon:yes stop_codon:yes gene_type:complete